MAMGKATRHSLPLQRVSASRLVGVKVVGEYKLDRAPEQVGFTDADAAFGYVAAAALAEGEGPFFAFGDHLVELDVGIEVGAEGHAGEWADRDAAEGVAVHGLEAAGGGELDRTEVVLGDGVGARNEPVQAHAFDDLGEGAGGEAAVADEGGVGGAAVREARTALEVGEQ